MEDKDAVIRQQWQIIQEQQAEIRKQHQELAWRRYRDHLVDESPWGFALWLCLHDVFPFTLWYRRFER